MINHEEVIILKLKKILSLMEQTLVGEKLIIFLIFKSYKMREPYNVRTPFERILYKFLGFINQNLITEHDG